MSKKLYELFDSQLDKIVCTSNRIDGLARKMNYKSDVEIERFK